MKAGDLVRKVTDTELHPHVAGIGIIVDIDDSFEERPHIRVMWSGDYGTFWAHRDSVKLIFTK